MGINATAQTPYLTGPPVRALFQQALQLVTQGFERPVPVEDNLSIEGRVVRELCSVDPLTCKLAFEQINGHIANSQCRADVWPELMVYEVGGFSEGGVKSDKGGPMKCAVNRTELRRIRARHGLLGYGAPEEEFAAASAT